MIGPTGVWRVMPELLLAACSRAAIDAGLKPGIGKDTGKRIWPAAAEGFICEAKCAGENGIAPAGVEFPVESGDEESADGHDLRPLRFSGPSKLFSLCSSP